MAEQWTCPQCRRINAEDAHFCTQCGAGNPATATQTGGSRGTWLASLQSRRRLLWVAAAGLWLIGCVILAVGGSTWLLRQSRVSEVEPSAKIEITPAAATESLRPTPTSALIPTPTATFEPATPTLTSTPLATTESKPPSATPTRASAGVILFLSSRDHDPQTEAEQRKLAQNRYVELYAMLPDGRNQTRLSDGQQQWWNGVASLTPYYRPNQIVINGAFVFDLTTRHVVEELKLEFPNTEPTVPFLALSPVWSPEGKIVFYGNKWRESASIYYLDNDRGEPQRLTNPPDQVVGDVSPVWSPDGKWIAFYRNWHDDAKNGIWLMKPDGSEAHRVLVGEDVDRVSWSPDGSRLVFEGPKSNATVFSFEAWVAEADGSNPRQLTSFPGDTRGALNPKWSPDGQRIVFQNDFDRGHIFVVDANGDEPRQLTTIGDANLSPLWVPLVPDDILISSATSISTSDTVVSHPTATPTLKPTVAASPATTCPPGVQITSPRPGAVFTQRYNYIVGTADIPRFHHWKIEYSTNPNGGWVYLLQRDYPVKNDKLIMLDASTIPIGPYGLRLTVVDETGNYPEPCVVWYTNTY